MLGRFLMSLKHWNDIFSLNIHGAVSSTDWTERPAALTQSVPGVLLGGSEFRAKFLVQKCQHGSKPSQSPIGNLLSILMINGIVLWMYHVAGILILHSAMQINLFFLLLRAFTCVELYVDIILSLHAPLCPHVVFQQLFFSQDYVVIALLTWLITAGLTLTSNTCLFFWTPFLFNSFQVFSFFLRLKELYIVQ